MTLSCQHVCARDIVTSVSELHLKSGSACRPGQELMTKADTEDGGAVALHSRRDVLDGGIHHSRVSRTIGYEKTIVIFSGELGEVVVPRTDQNLNAAIQETPQLVVFQSDVQA